MTLSLGHCTVGRLGLLLGLALQAIAADHPPQRGGAGTEYDGVHLTAAGSATAAVLPLAVRVTDAVVRLSSPRLFGYNHVWLNDERLFVGEAGSLPSSRLLAVAAGLPMPLNRMSGTDSQFFHWKQAIGPLAERQKQEHDLPGHGSVRRVGPLEWIATCRAIDPTAAFSWTFNCFQEEPQDHADLAEFLTGIAGENLDAGEDWAARRAALGVRDPLPVAIWEIGNELDWDARYLPRFPDAAAYAAYCRATIAAVRRAQPNARFAVQAATAPWSWEAKGRGDWRSWHRTVLDAVGADIDWVVIHPYYAGLPIAVVESYLDVLRDDLWKRTGGRVGIYISEHARWPAKPDTGAWRINWRQTHDLAGCLATAHFLARIMQRPEVTAATYHAFNGGPWGVIRDTDAANTQTTPLYATGIAELHHLLAPLHQGDVLACTMEGERSGPDDGQASAAAVAVRQADGRLTLLLVNREALTVRNATLSLPGTYRLAGGEILTAPDPQSVNTADATPIVRQPIPAGGLATSWMLPPHSAVRLDLELRP